MEQDKTMYEIVCNSRFNSIENKIDNLHSKIDASQVTMYKKFDAMSDKLEPFKIFQYKVMGGLVVISIIISIVTSVITSQKIGEFRFKNLIEEVKAETHK